MLGVAPRAWSAATKRSGETQTRGTYASATGYAARSTAEKAQLLARYTARLSAARSLRVGRMGLLGLCHLLGDHRSPVLNWLETELL